jgi:hypothetical protein
MVFYVQYGSPLWGVIRREALRKTRLMVGCALGDFVLLAELVMLGKAVEVRERLLRLREHPGNAARLFSDHRKLLAWCDPSAASKRLLFSPKIEALIEYHKSVWHLPLARWDKMTCLAVPCSVLLWRACLRWSGPLRGQVGLRRSIGLEAQDNGSERVNVT